MEGRIREGADKVGLMQVGLIDILVPYLLLSQVS